MRRIWAGRSAGLARRGDRGGGRGAANPFANLERRRIEAVQHFGPEANGVDGQQAAVVRALQVERGGGEGYDAPDVAARIREKARVPRGIPRLWWAVRTTWMRRPELERRMRELIQILPT